MSKVLCIYHASCADGLGAAWAVHCALGEEVEFVAAKYGERVVGFRGSLPIAEGLLECIIGRDVLIVDFSYPLLVLRAMAQEARSVLVLDHHKTAQEDLAGIGYPNGSYEQFREACAGARGTSGNLAAIFDLIRSGAGLTWDYLHPNTPRPRIIDLIEDRDLWRFKFGDETRAFHAVLTSYDITDLPVMFKMLDALDGWTDWKSLEYEQWNIDDNDWTTIRSEGRAILRAQRQATASAVAASRRTIKILDYVVPCANVPPAMASDAGHLLCHPQTDYLNEPISCFAPNGDYANTEALIPLFSATYYDGADGKRHFSLRSPEGGADCGAIAKQMAAYFKNQDRQRELDKNLSGNLSRVGNWTGGGHLHAAGFDAPLGWEGE